MSKKSRGHIDVQYHGDIDVQLPKSGKQRKSAAKPNTAKPTKHRFLKLDISILSVLIALCTLCAIVVPELLMYKDSLWGGATQSFTVEAYEAQAEGTNLSSLTDSDNDGNQTAVAGTSAQENTASVLQSEIKPLNISNQIAVATAKVVALVKEDVVKKYPAAVNYAYTDTKANTAKNSNTNSGTGTKTVVSENTVYNELPEKLKESIAEGTLPVIHQDETNTESASVSLLEYVTEDNVTVTLTGDMPKNASLRLAAVPEDVLSEILEIVGSDTPIFAYDITIVDGEGNEWQPDELGVNVSITGLSVPDGTVEVAHVPDEGEVEVMESSITENSIAFNAPGFSVYLAYYSAKPSTDTTTSTSTNTSTNTSTSNSNSTASVTPTLAASAATANTVVNVAVNWSEAPTSGEIVVTLYKDGVATDNTLTLNSDNSWQGRFTGLEDGAVYTIQYTEISGYTYASASETTETSASWQEASSLVSGNTYLLVHNTSKAVQNSSGSTLSQGTVTVSGTAVTSTVTDAMKWYYNGTSLENQATTYYLRLSSNSAKTSSTEYTMVYENGKIKYAGNSGTRYLQVNGTGYTVTTVSGSATSFTLYTETAASTGLTFTVTGTKQAEEPDEPDEPEESQPVAFEHNKTIDYLGDGVDNPDTDLNGENDYRLYLDMTGRPNPIDLIFVVDGSNSMYHTDIDSGTRDAAITKFLNGSATGYDAENSAIAKILAMNPENRVSVIQFDGTCSDLSSSTLVSNDAYSYTNDSRVLMDWQTEESFASWINTNDYVDCTRITNSGTNYEAGFERATEQLGLDTVSEDGNRKIMVFLSDGVPTFFLVDESDVGTEVGVSQDWSTTDYTSYTLQSSDVGHCWGRGQTVEAKYCAEPSKLAYQEFLAANPGITVYTIGIYGSGSSDSDKNTTLLQYMADEGNGKFFEFDGSFDGLLDEITSIFYPKGVTITDQLSKYVRYSDTPDVSVTMKHKTTGEETVLYKDGSVTSAASGILTSVSYTAGDTSTTPTASTGTVTALFDTEYQFHSDYTYTLSFNVTTTQTAVDEKAATGYNATGDEATDYGSNATSSGKDGFYSNNSAIVNYFVSGSAVTDTYSKPVVQVPDEPDDPDDPEDPDPGDPDDGELTDKAPDHRKYIDAFRDNQDNPDTDLDDQVKAGTVDEDINDLYRLYLDLGPESSYRPLDVIFVFDASSSMARDAGTGGYDAKDILGNTSWRCWALDTLLNGESETNPNVPASTVTYANNDAQHQRTLYDNGLLSIIANLNANNRVAAVQFAKTSEILLDGGWKTASEILSDNEGIVYNNAEGTNYVAGLQSAMSLLETANDDSKKVMIFISDGRPTWYYSPLSSTTLDGTGKEKDAINSTTTATVIDEFLATDLVSGMIDSDMLDIYTIGIGNFETSTLAKLSTDGEVLASAEFDEILKVLDKSLTDGVGHYTNLKLTDTLSDYVQFYQANLDFKVELVTTDSSGNEVKQVLYQYDDDTGEGALTELGKKYIKADGVSIDFDTGTVNVEFLDSYEEEGNTVYRVSFNVKTTEQAYREFGENTANVAIVDGYKGNAGDKNTDYTANTTSSTKGGFNSNKIASLEYAQALGDNVGETKTANFDFPVIQVDDSDKCKLTVKKSVSGTASTELFSFELKVEGADYSDTKLPANISLKDGSVNVLTFNLANGGEITFNSLIPENAEVTLTETNHSGYSVMMNIGDIGIHNGDSQTFTLSSTTEVLVINSSGQKLPETGGMGTLIYLLSGIIILLCIPFFLYFLKYKRGRRHSH